MLRQIDGSSTALGGCNLIHLSHNRIEALRQRRSRRRLVCSDFTLLGTGDICVCVYPVTLLVLPCSVFIVLFFWCAFRLTAWPKAAKVSQEEVDALHKEHYEFLIRFHSLVSSTNRPGELLCPPSKRKKQCGQNVIDGCSVYYRPVCTGFLRTVT